MQRWTGPFGGVPPWDRVTAPKLRAALLEGIELQRAEIAAIADNPAPPTFANTSVALQMAGEPLDRAEDPVRGDDPEHRFGRLSGRRRPSCRPCCRPPAGRITFNEKLFQRVKHVADHADEMGLNAQRERIVRRSRDDFVRNRAALNAAGKAELGRINTALSNAFTSFGQEGGGR